MCARNDTHMSQGLSSSVRFFVMRCTPPAKEGVIVARKKGYISFLNEENADKMASRLAKKAPGSRFYVLTNVSGHLFPEKPTLQSVSY